MLLLLLVTVTALHCTTADYSCLCSYHIERKVYATPNVSSTPAGYLYEFDCKPILENAIPNLDQKWVSIAFEHEVNFYFPLFFPLLCLEALVVFIGLSLCFHLDIYFRLFITKNAENSACQEDHVAAIIDFVTVGLVVVLCLGYGQLTPWSVRL